MCQDGYIRECAPALSQKAKRTLAALEKKITRAQVFFQKSRKERSHVAFFTTQRGALEL